MKVDVRFDLRRDPLRWIRQFRDLDPQDPGRWPPAPQITVMVLLFALIVAGAWWFFWTSQAEELERVKGQEKELRDQWLVRNGKRSICRNTGPSCARPKPSSAPC